MALILYLTQLLPQGEVVVVVGVLDSLLVTMAVLVAALLEAPQHKAQHPVKETRQAPHHHKATMAD